jgi:cation diffusion facilitator CzcD-associated flavoprotein CzcO
VRGEKAEKARAKVEQKSTNYIVSKTPRKYHKFIVPDFPLGRFISSGTCPIFTMTNHFAGCKRRIFDPGYLEALNSPKVDLVNEGITKITETGIISSKGIEDKFDIIVYATGYKVSDFLTPMEIIGSMGISLHQQWKENRGAQAYMGTYVHNFPNFGML